MLPELRWEREALLRLAVGLFLFMAFGGVIGAELLEPGQQWARFLVGTASFHGAILLLVAVLMRAQGLTWAETFGLKQGGLWRVAWIGVVTAFLALPMAWALSWASAEMMRAFFVEPSPQQAVTSLQASRGMMEQCSMGFMAVVVVPMAEEILFRGLLYPIVKERTRPWLAVLSTSLVFGAIHGNLMTFVPLTVFAMVLVGLYEATGNLVAPVMAHSVFNLANLLLLLGVGSI